MNESTRKRLLGLMVEVSAARKALTNKLLAKASGRAATKPRNPLKGFAATGSARVGRAAQVRTISSKAGKAERERRKEAGKAERERRKEKKGLDWEYYTKNIKRAMHGGGTTLMGRIIQAGDKVSGNAKDTVSKGVL